MAQQRYPLGQVQLEVLQYICDHHPVRVNDVATHFAETSGKARTTILTVMEKLREKGYLRRRKRNGTYHYAPRYAKADLMMGIVQRFVEESLGGSVSPFIAYLAESGKLSESEVARLRRLARELEAREEEERS
jgi:predicted transcriptional regulator